MREGRELCLVPAFFAVLTSFVNNRYCACFNASSVWEKGLWGILLDKKFRHEIVGHEPCTSYFNCFFSTLLHMINIDCRFICDYIRKKPNYYTITTRTLHEFYTFFPKIRKNRLLFDRKNAISFGGLRKKCYLCGIITP